MLTQELFQKPFSLTTSKIRPQYIPSDGDFRHVLVARDIYQAIASGYLYHESGHECWLTFNGQSRSEMGMEEKKFAFNISIPDVPHERTDQFART